MVEIFADKNKNELLQSHGYAIVPFLNEAEVKQLTDFFYAHHQALPEGMYATSHAPDFGFRQKMNEEIKQVCQRAVTQTFDKATPLGATYMVKSKGEQGSLHPHQDWSILDESQHNSYNIWLPLVDTNEANGTLLILPESHNWLNNTRGLNIPSSFENVEKEIWKYLVPVNVKAGEALVYDHRLLHASSVNKTDTPRLVIVYGVIPAKADMRYYFGRDNQIEEYSCTADFYFSETITNGPGSLTMLQSLPNNNPVVTSDTLKQRYQKSNGFFEKLWNYLKPATA